MSDASKLDNWTGVVSRSPVTLMREVSNMDIMLYIDNLDISTTEEELGKLFMQAGEVIAVKINRDRVSGASKGFGFITMSAQSEADKAVSRFNSRLISGHKLKVRLAIPRAQRGTTSPIIEP